MRAVLLMTSALLALGAACGDSQKFQALESGPQLEAVQLELTLPNGSELHTLAFHVSGNGAVRTGTIDVRDSTRASFRVGSLPVGPGYTLLIAGTTASGVSCAGTAGFDVHDNQVTQVTMQIRCDGPVVGPPVDERGDIATYVNVTRGADRVCPVVTGLSILPLQAAQGAQLVVEGFTSSGAIIQWSASGGLFANPDAPSTTMTCMQVGLQTVRFEVVTPGCSRDLETVEVECGTTLCGDGSLDSGEACDDGNTLAGDGCSPLCAVEPTEPPPLPAHCPGVCPENSSVCLQLPTPPQCLGGCGSGCCSLSNNVWSLEVWDCPSGADAGL